MPRRFSVYKHPETGRTEVVKIGFCFPCLLLGGFWMLAIGLNKRAAVWIVVLLASPVPIVIIAGAIDGVLGLSESMTDAEINAALDAFFEEQLALGVVLASLYWIIPAIVYGALLLVPAFSCNRWLAQHLEHRGFQQLRTLGASSKHAALVEVIGRQDGSAP